MRVLLIIPFILIVIIAEHTNTAASQNVSYSKIIFKYIKRRAEHIIEAAGVKSQCARDLKTLFSDVIHKKRWALEMLDASAKVSSGFFGGNYLLLGNFDQCINIHEQKEDNEINGQYCTVFLTPSTTLHNSQFSFLFDSMEFADYMGISNSKEISGFLELFKVTYGLCIPQSCSIGNLQKLWDYVELTFGIPAHAVFLDFLCSNKGKPIEPYDVDKYVHAFFWAVLFILLASTWYDVMIHQYLEDKQETYWIAFSLYTNSKKLFSYTSRSASDGYLECLNGIKVLSMLWIVWGHRIILNIFSGNINSIYVFEWKEHWENSFFFAVSFAVDTFFALSGLLLSHTFLKYKSTLAAGKKISFMGFYLFRWLRLSPALLATILFYISIFKKMTDGPMWPLVVKKFAGSCLNTWWATFFFFANYFPIKHQCIEQSWYLGVDSQLYFISPIILISLTKAPWRTCLACLGLSMASAVYAYLITINNNYGTTASMVSDAFHIDIYQSTFVRMPAWLIGFVFGYVIFKYKQVRISKVVNICLWIFALSLMLYIMLVHVVFVRNTHSALRSAIFNSCARPAWALCVCLIVFSCVTGHGGLINTFLSWPIFQVIAKMSYSIFLVHVAVILYFIGGKKYTGYFSNINSYRDFIGDVFFTLLAATILCLAFESPFLAIGQIMFKTAHKKEIIQKIETTQKKSRKKKNYVVCVYSYEDGKKVSSKKIN